MSFDDLFGSFFGTSGARELKPPLNEGWQDESGKWWLLLQRVDGFVGLFAAVEVSSPEDRIAHGKPLCMIVHTPSILAYREAQRQAKITRTQTDFTSQVEKHYFAKGTVEERSQGFLRTKVNVNLWTTPVQKETCPSTCRTRMGWKADFVENDGLLACYCEIHRGLILEYMGETGTVWPPKVHEQPVPA